jgi:tripartite-type tricarboxylate transporter receptor subunit TctC
MLPEDGSCDLQTWNADQMEERNMQTILSKMLVAGALIGLASSAFADVSTVSAYPYPDRPVRLIVPFTSGGVSDVLGHFTAQKLSENLDERFYVQSVPGGGTNIGMAAAAKAKPDYGTTVERCAYRYYGGPKSPLWTCKR